jgi:hypothetical protein
MDRQQLHHVGGARIFQKAYRPSLNLVQFLKSIWCAIMAGTTTSTGGVDRYYVKKKLK